MSTSENFQIYLEKLFPICRSITGDANRETLKRIYRTRINVSDGPTSRSKNLRIRHDESTGMGFVAPPQQTGTSAQGPPPQGRRQPIRAEEKIGRNEPCPCGSGKKYKKCHG